MIDDLAKQFNNSCPLCNRYYKTSEDLKRHRGSHQKSAKQTAYKLCRRCGCAIGHLNYQDTGETQAEHIEREINYRQNFPNTWDYKTGRELVCDECFGEMMDDTSDFEKSQL